MKRILFFVAICISSLTLMAQSALYPVQIKGKWGYTNLSGKLTINAMYDYAENFYDGLAVVALNNQPCAINDKNERIIDTGLYINIQHYSEGLAKVTNVKLQQFFVDVKGKKVFDVAGDVYDARPFKNGLSGIAKKSDIHETKFSHDIVNLGYKFGYINKQGVEVIACIYDDADDFDNGYARVKTDRTFGVIDTLGNQIIKSKYFNIGKFIEGKAWVDAGGNYGYINTIGEEIIKPIYQYTYDFSEGLGGILLKGKYGFIDEKGTVIIAPQYEAIRPFSQGLAAVKLNGKWGFIDKTGAVKLRFVFDNAMLFVNDRCAVLVKRKWGFIDTNGAFAIPADFDAVGTFNDGIAEVMLGQVSVYITKQGVIIPQLK
ncbi:MAG: WG repeat-containing protein [Bacteroidia bacterium]|nr:WG repeat-containing protein [Bacteroidia bacterium]